MDWASMDRFFSDVQQQVKGVIYKVEGAVTGGLAAPKKNRPTLTVRQPNLRLVPEHELGEAELEKKEKLEADIVGRWCYGSSSYQITCVDGKFLFKEGRRRGELVASADGESMIAKLAKCNGEVLGSIRIRHTAGKLISNFRAKNSSNWGVDVDATRECALPNCSTRVPRIGDQVVHKAVGQTNTLKDADDNEAAWELLAREVATVCEVDDDLDFRLQNSHGVTSGWAFRKNFCYTTPDAIVEIDSAHDWVTSSSSSSSSGPRCQGRSLPASDEGLPNCHPRCQQSRMMPDAQREGLPKQLPHAKTTPPQELHFVAPEDCLPGRPICLLGPHGDAITVPLPDDVEPGKPCSVHLGPKASFKVIVPQGAMPGTMVLFSTEEGEMLNTVVPLGKMPGDTFEIAPPVVMVQVPAGMKGGGECCYTTPTGMLAAVTIPAELHPGHYFPVLLPLPPQMAEIVVKANQRAQDAEGVHQPRRASTFEQVVLAGHQSLQEQQQRDQPASLPDQPQQKEKRSPPSKWAETTPAVDLDLALLENDVEIASVENNEVRQLKAEERPTTEIHEVSPTTTGISVVKVAIPRAGTPELEEFPEFDGEEQSAVVPQEEVESFVRFCEEHLDVERSNCSERENVHTEVPENAETASAGGVEKETV